MLMFLSDKELSLETLDFTIRIGSTATFFIFCVVMRKGGVTLDNVLKSL